MGSVSKSCATSVFFWHTMSKWPCRSTARAPSPPPLPGRRTTRLPTASSAQGKPRASAKRLMCDRTACSLPDGRGISLNSAKCRHKLAAPWSAGAKSRTNPTFTASTIVDACRDDTRNNRLRLWSLCAYAALATKTAPPAIAEKLLAPRSDATEKGCICRVKESPCPPMSAGRAKRPRGGVGRPGSGLTRESIVRHSCDGDG
mmetsp:Transcript_81981/g.213851  ORF Transcript_81981/g.213851 Transcript_81981/m.213851 type:complete len:202 (+) Transcript_81981:1350-1955(+)